MAVSSKRHISVRAQFQRSIRLDADFDQPDVLSGYIMQPCAKAVLDSVAHHVRDTNQRAFTWTGPYGGGKSSLALVTAALSGGHAHGRKIARDVLGLEPDDAISRVFGTRKPWLVLPVVGRRGSVEDAIASTLDHFSPVPGRRPMRDGRRDVIAELIRQAENKSHSGVLLILDELGKFLESAALNGDDIYFYQELAEAAGRCSGKLVIVGVLHQAFEQYASRSGRAVREEWAKIQGRFVDIPVVAGTDEVIDLIGRAIDNESRHPKSRSLAKRVAAQIRSRRPSMPSSLADSLDRCWPLHPVTAALLGPSSRRKFGQNERSVFGFLSSAEPLAFNDFLVSSGDAVDVAYTPAHYWDYLKVNLEGAILSSPDAHRWAMGAEAVERCEARFGATHAAIVKAVALIDMFRAGSGLLPDRDLLIDCLHGVSASDVDSALVDLAKASILVYRKHLQAWALFAGSDFDIETSMSNAMLKVDVTAHSYGQIVAQLPTVPARRHYDNTGTFRWFNKAVVSVSRSTERVGSVAAASCAGSFVILLPSDEMRPSDLDRVAKLLSENDNDGALSIVGIIAESSEISAQMHELLALELVAKQSPGLEGDAVARRELDGRMRVLKATLETALSDAFSNASWYFAGERLTSPGKGNLSQIASTVCDRAFVSCPVIHSEILNRDSLSSSAAKAQRLLLHRMLAFADRAQLDYAGFPSDAGLYYSVLAPLGLHREIDGVWAFRSPVEGIDAESSSIAPAWKAAMALLQSADEALPLSRVYSLWQSRPYGVKKGVLPVLALAFLLANRSQIAVYVEGTFVPEMTDAGVDEWLQDPARVAWKAVEVDRDAKGYLKVLAEGIEQRSGKSVAPTPLDIARVLVAMTLALPSQTQRSARLTERARSIRTALMRASDPIKVLFSDIPELLDERQPKEVVNSLKEIFDELEGAYPATLRGIERLFLKALDFDGKFETLRRRAELVHGTSGDFRLEAFAARLKRYQGSLDDIEALTSLAVGRPAAAFTDHDMDQASVQLAKWGFEFRSIEALASLSTEGAARHAITVIVSGRMTRSATFDLAEGEQHQVERLASEILSDIGPNIRGDVVLAALAEAGVRLLEHKDGDLD
jgi:hypothetical protein